MLLHWLQETQVQSLGQEDPLQEEMATHFSILAWRIPSGPPSIGSQELDSMAPHSSTLAWKIPWTEEPGGPQSMGSLRVRQDSATSPHFSLSCIREGNGNPLQCSCLENPRDGGAWWAAVYGGRTESDTTEAT